MSEMSDYQDYSWRVALGDTETEMPDLSYITYSNQEDTDMDIMENSTFDVSVCGNLTDNYKRVTIKHRHTFNFGAVAVDTVETV